MAATIHDIAKRLNVSKSTVSKALNNYPDVAESTRMRVLQVAQELGYQPSAAARSLSLGRTNRFGLFLNTSIDYVLDYLSGVIPSATTQANALGQHLLLYTTADNSPEKLFEVFGTREIDGVVLF
ncbi:MAG: LacI family DNA-binding transcriptional regulator, partial [Chloroflexota bacterium]